MNKTEIETAREISARRIAYLRSRGEDKRNTVAWRDACHEEWHINFLARCAA